MNDRRVQTLCLLAALVIVAGLTARIARVYAVSSDDATGVLEADAVLHGNPLLHGWTLSNVSFVTTDLPFYLVGVAVLGVRPSLLRDVPVAVFVAALAASIVLAAGRARGGRWWLGAAAVLIMIGMPAGGLAEFVSKGYMRVGTTLGLFVAFTALDISSDQRLSFRRLAWFSIWLTLTLVADSYALVLGGLPVLMVCVLGALGINDYGVRRAGPLSLCVIAAIAAGQGISWLISALGGYEVVPLPLSEYLPWPDPLRVIARNALVLAVNLPSLYRCDWPAWPSMLWLGCLIGPGLLFVVLANTPPIRSRPADLVGDVLWFSMLLGLAAYLLSANPKDRGTMRYMIPFVLSGGVLIGRFVAMRVRDVQISVIFLVLLLIAYAFTILDDFRKPLAADRAATLASWLEERDLRHGYGSYWNSSIVTVFSAGRVTVRAVKAVPISPIRAVIEPFRWMSDAAWYEREGPATFVVFEPKPNGFYQFALSLQTCTSAFGPPSSTHTVGPYAVLVWDRDLRPLLARPSRRNDHP